jgi:hypothetical protein
MVTPLYGSGPATVPIYLGIDGEHLFAHGRDANIDFDLEAQQDGCSRGTMNGYPLEVCPVTNERGTSGSVKAWRVSGPLGDRTFTTELEGDRVYVDFGISQGRAQFLLPEGLPRQHPEMVGAAFFYGAFGRPRPGSETQAYLIQKR